MSKKVIDKSYQQIFIEALENKENSFIDSEIEPLFVPSFSHSQMGGKLRFGFVDTNFGVEIEVRFQNYNGNNEDLYERAVDYLRMRHKGVIKI